MLKDIQVTNNLFGVSYFDSTASELDVPAIGSIGCVAEVTETQTFPDGRSNILSVGVVRYRIESYVDRGDPYLVARVDYFEDDEEESDQLSDAASEVAEMFTRIARAVRTINDERPNLPDISNTDPERLSFLVAAALEVDVDVKQSLLEMRSTYGRLQSLQDMLVQSVGGYEERARVHELAKGNGHSGKKIEIE